MTKNNGRRASTSLTFSGKNMDVILAGYLESVSYTDVASGASDTLNIKLSNIDEKWLTEWYPKKGNTVSGKLLFKNWRNDGKTKAVRCGSFTLDEIKTEFKPKTMTLSCVSAPVKESFKVRERSKTWE